MSVEAPGVEAQVYEQLAERARVHFGESALSAIVKIGDYDPSRPTHDMDRVFFEAEPNDFTPFIFSMLSSALTAKTPRGVTRGVVEPFEPMVEEITESIMDRKLMVLTGHQTMFEIPLDGYGVQRAVAAYTGDFYSDMVERTHLIAARALSTADIFGRIPLTKVAQMLTNLYYSFPATDNYRADGSIPLEFQQAKNAVMLDQFAANTEGTGKLGVMAASGTTEKKDKAAGVYVIPRIGGDENHGTMSVLLDGWDLLPVGGVFKHGLKAEPGEIIPAAEVSPAVIHEVMESVIAASRGPHGRPTVYGEA